VEEEKKVEKEGKKKCKINSKGREMERGGEREKGEGGVPHYMAFKAPG